MEREETTMPTSALETICERRGYSSEKLVRERLPRLAECIRKDGAPYPLTAPLVNVWVDVFVRANVSPEQAEAAFDKAEREFKFWPAPSEVLSLIEHAQKTATREAAEQAWEYVLDLRRRYWNPDMPGGFSRGMPELPEQIQQAARAAGVFRDYESQEALHVWAKKRFIESFTAWGELEQDKFLLPDGEIKNLLAGEAKELLPPPTSYEEARERGLAYSKKLKASGCNELDRQRAMGAIVQKAVPPPREVRSLEEQKRILRERGFLPPLPAAGEAIDGVRR